MVITYFIFGFLFRLQNNTEYRGFKFTISTHILLQKRQRCENGTPLHRRVGRTANSKDGVQFLAFLLMSLSSSDLAGLLRPPPLPTTRNIQGIVDQTTIRSGAKCALYQVHSALLLQIATTFSDLLRFGLNCEKRNYDCETHSSITVSLFFFFYHKRQSQIRKVAEELFTCTTCLNCNCLCCYDLLTFLANTIFPDCISLEIMLQKRLRLRLRNYKFI